MMSALKPLETIRCGHCGVEIPQIGSKDKTFCDAKCNNANYTFKNKTVNEVDDIEMKQALKEQLTNNVPTIILSNLVKNYKREIDKTEKKPRYTNQIACFYKNMIMNLSTLLSQKSIYMVKQDLVASSAKLSEFHF